MFRSRLIKIIQKIKEDTHSRYKILYLKYFVIFWRSENLKNIYQIIFIEFPSTTLTLVLQKTWLITTFIAKKTRCLFQKDPV